MVRRSQAGLNVIIKNLRRIAPYPWIGAKLFKLQVEKQFFNLLHPDRATGRAGKIRQASFRITDLCNLRCHTCGQWGDSGFLHGHNLKQLKEKEVTPQRYLEIFKDLTTHGHRPLIYFWGGEPMLYQGIMELIEGAASLGLPPSIATNGTRMAEMAVDLVRAPLFLLQVSVDGHCAELHNQVRPSAGGGNNFADIQTGLQAVREARRAQGRSLPVIAGLTVISQANLAYLLDIYEAFRDKVDLFVFYLSWWIDHDRAEAHEQDFLRRFGFLPIRHRGWIGNWKPSDPELLYQQLRRLAVASRRWSSPAVTVIPPITDSQSLKAYYGDHRQTFAYNQCVSIYQSVEVNSNGNLSPCRDYHDYVVGNIKEATVTELWNSEPYRRFRASLCRDGLMPVCSRCCGLMGY